jgi:hypothetical protein
MSVIARILNTTEASSIATDGPCAAQRPAIDAVLLTTMLANRDPFSYLLEAYQRALQAGKHPVHIFSCPFLLYAIIGAICTTHFSLFFGQILLFLANKVVQFRRRRVRRIHPEPVCRLLVHRPTPAFAIRSSNCEIQR